MLISPAYLAEQKRLHAKPEGYGGKGRRWLEEVQKLMVSFGCSSVLDYGCGQGSLGSELRALGVNVSEYDPAIPGKNKKPSPADLVVCTDVLEHVEPAFIDAVLDDLAALSKRAAFVVVSLVPTSKMLSDGRQAHILLRPVEWWQVSLEERFIVTPVDIPNPEKQWGAALALKV